MSQNLSLVPTESLTLSAQIKSFRSTQKLMHVQGSGKKKETEEGKNKRYLTTHIPSKD